MIEFNYIRKIKIIKSMYKINKNFSKFKIK